MEVTMYSTNCPKCKVLEAKLNGKGVRHSVVTDVDAMVAKGMSSAPMLEVDGKLMGFPEAVRWVNGLANG